MKKPYTTIILATLIASFALWAGAQVDIQPHPPTVERPIASPRVSVATHPNLVQPTVDAVEANRCCRQIGAAFNFARRDARMVIRQGTTVDFSIPRAEGVVYEKSCGWLALYVRLDVQDANGHWRFLDNYFRHVRVSGPHIAHAEDIAIPYRPREPGQYLVRATIVTYAIPVAPDLALDRSKMRCADIARDTVLTSIRVVGRPTPADLEWEAAEPVELIDDRVGELEVVEL